MDFLSRIMGSQSGTDTLQKTLLRIATRISKDLAKGKLPPLNDEMKQFSGIMPQVVIELLSLMVDHFDNQEEPNEFLVNTFLNLMRQQLEEIRYAVDRKFEWAKEFVEVFQNEVAELVDSDRLPFMVVKAILDAILDAKLEHSPVLLQAYDEMMERNIPETIPNRNEFLQVLKGFVEEHENDPFGISEGISDLMRYMPKEGQSAIIGEFFHADLPSVKDVVSLLTLNPEDWIRNEALQWLLGNAQTITPTALRRLIVIRNWIPESERKILDQVTKAARVKGVECAQWTPGEKIEKIQASQIDGSGAQGLMLVTKLGAKFRLSSVLVKECVGIADAWSTPVITKRDLSETLNHARESSALTDVSEHYLNTIIRHYIQVGLDSGAPPQIGLLRVAETMGMTGWLAQRCDIPSLWEKIIDESTELALVEDIIQTSAIWGELPGISDSWFEDSQDMVIFLQKSRTRKRDQLIQQILLDFCEPNRQSWAEKFAWTAFWLSEQPTLNGKKNQLAYNFAIIARELNARRAMTTIPLMGAIAKRTVDALG